MVVGAGAKVLGAINVGANTRIGAGSVVRNVEADCTVVGIPGWVIHQSGVRINPWPTALPDAEANVIRNLMERIDELESTVSNLQRCLKEVAEGRQLRDVCRVTRTSRTVKFSNFSVEHRLNFESRPHPQTIILFATERVQAEELTG